ncbi:Borcs6 [Columba livia]|nr:Borcs6 [Columba livia]
MNVTALTLNKRTNTPLPAESGLSKIQRPIFWELSDLTEACRPSFLIQSIDQEGIQPKDLKKILTVAAQVDELLRNVHCGLQALTALSVGCIQTYRDGVESLGEAADLSIRAMYALVARCEELDRAMQPVPALAKRIRDMKGTLERLEGLCK